MDRLVKTALFSILEKMDGIFTPEWPDIMAVYDDFVQSVISLCTSAKEGVPVYFTLHYTHLKLEEFQSILNSRRAEKKCAGTELHRPLPFLY